MFMHCWQLNVQVRTGINKYEEASLNSYGEIPEKVFKQWVWEHRLGQMMPKWPLGRQLIYD